MKMARFQLLCIVWQPNLLLDFFFNFSDDPFSSDSVSFLASILNIYKLIKYKLRSDIRNEKKNACILSQKNCFNYTRQIFDADCRKRLAAKLNINWNRMEYA